MPVGRRRKRRSPLALGAVLLVAGCSLTGAARASSPPEGGLAACTPGQTDVAPGRVPGVAVTLDVDVSAAVHAISPYVYGSNLSHDWRWDAATRGLTFVRAGGNRWSTYNWENNASNAGSDWNHQNDGLLGGGDVPGEAVRSRVADARAHGASILVTLPLLDRVAADKNRDGDVAKTPDYRDKRFVANAPRKNAPFTYPPSLTDGVVYQDELVAWLTKRFPGADTDPTKRIFYSLDNEPALWPSTHPRIHPKPTRYETLIGRSVALARAVKHVDPRALVFGPASYGWMGMANLQSAPDGRGRFFLAAYLDAMHRASKVAGHRLLDVLDVHWYPEVRAGGKRTSSPDASPAVVAARLQSTRSLWDPSYDEGSWVSRAGTGGPIRLIPRLFELIAAHDPGTRLAITEYFFGGGDDISGALAQADALGIFGREGLFAASVWTADRPHAFIFPAFAMYRDLDGQGLAFGDTSVKASTTDLAEVTVYAATDTAHPGRVTIVAVNKSTSPRQVALRIAGAACLKHARVFRLTAARKAPVAAGTLAPEVANGFRDTLPARSVTTYVLAP